MDSDRAADLRAEIIRDIEAAFDGVERGEGVTLHEAWAIDCCASDRKRAKARKSDTDTRWKDIPASDIENCPSALAFMDAEGFRYYIPAYMVWTLRNYLLSD